MEKLSNTEAELKKSVAYTKRVQLGQLETQRIELTYLKVFELNHISYINHITTTIDKIFTINFRFCEVFVVFSNFFNSIKRILILAGRLRTKL